VRTGGAHLPGHPEDARGDALQSLIEVGILEHDVGGFATQFEMHPFHPPAGRSETMTTVRSEAVKLTAAT
jgi:hypothetical protein